MTARRKAWFEYSWFPGMFVWPCSPEGWAMFIGGPAVGLLLVGAFNLIQRLLPGSGVALIPLVLLLVFGIAFNLVAFGRMRRRGEVREEEINYTARRLFGGEPWRPRRPRPLIPERPRQD